MSLDDAVGPAMHHGDPGRGFLIKGGYLINGESPDVEPQPSDILIEGDRIKAISRCINGGSHRIIDAKGLYVCPGFIDTHCHSELTLLVDGRAEGKIAQGITTEINGNCGFSSAPLYGDAIRQREEEFKELGITEQWNTLDEYLRILMDRGIALNFLTLVGHGNIRASVVGYEDRGLSSSEMDEAIALLNEAIASGGRGFSTGLVYPPGCYSDTEEIIALVEVVNQHGGIYTTHIRDEGNKLLESIDEVITIIQMTKVKAHISHLKTYGKENWSKIEDVVEVFDTVNKDGLVLTCDRYPYTASCTSLDSLLPLWVFEGGREAELIRLRKDRERIINELRAAPHNLPDWRDVMISSVLTDKNRWMEGKSMYDISIVLNKRPEDCLFDILIDERLEVSAIFFSMSEDNMKKILKLPYTMIGSDSSARSFDGVTRRGRPHPRSFGTFPRILRRYVRDEGVLTIGEAIYKMTGFPAKRFGIKERGVIKEGFFADITIFDLDIIEDTASYEDPFRKPKGVYYVFVNGLPVVFEGETTGIFPGRVI